MEKKAWRLIVCPAAVQSLVCGSLWCGLVSIGSPLPLWRNSQESADSGIMRFIFCGIFDFLLDRAFSLQEKEQPAGDDRALDVRKSG